MKVGCDAKYSYASSYTCASVRHWKQRSGPQSQSGSCGEGKNSLSPAGSFNRMQCRVVTGLLTGHNNLGRHLYIRGQNGNPMCCSCRAEKET